MNEWIRWFEAEVGLKVGQKSTVFVSGKGMMLKAFKYFDLGGSGVVEFGEWKKALQKIGMVLPELELCWKIFQYYDKENSGSLDYKVFCDQLYSKVQNKSLSSPTPQTAEKILLAIKTFLLTKTQLGIITLAHHFKVLSPQQTFVPFSVFSKTLFDSGAALDQSKIVLLFKFFDKDRQGAVNYLKLLQAVKGELSEHRKRILLITFNQIANGTEAVDLKFIKKLYAAGKHPDVISGKRSEKQVLEEFLLGFGVHHGLFSGKWEDSVSKQEFFDYYSFVSPAIEEDLQFELVLRNCWSDKMNKTVSIGKFDVVPKGFEKVFAKFRERLVARGVRGVVGIQKVFKGMDEDGSGELNLAEFRGGCLKFGLELGESEILRLFSAIDRDKSGVIDFYEFLKAVRGQISAGRKRVIEMAWGELDRENKGVVDFESVNLAFDARSHPDVKIGRRSVSEIINEFLETFETHHNNSDSSEKDNRVTFKEFLSYYECISITISSDQYFEAMMKSAWKFSEPINKTIQPNPIPYAGQRKSESRIGPPFDTSPEKTEYTTSSFPRTQSFKLSMPRSVSNFLRTNEFN